MTNQPQILIIEDEIEFAEMMKIRLELSEYHVSVAKDTGGGVQAILDHEFDLIVLDLMMPGGGGFSILEQIQGIPEKSRIPVVIVTGKTINSEVQAMIGAFKVAAVFLKPYDPIQFMDKIRSLVPPEK